MNPGFIEFANRRALSNRSLLIILLISLAFSAATAVDGYQLRDLNREQSDLDRQVAATRAKLADLKPPPVKPVSAEDKKWVATAIRGLNTPWDEIFDALEDHSREDTALLSVTPDSTVHGGQLRITAESKDFDAVIEYLNGLRDAPQFSNVQITKQEVMDRDPNRPLRFAVDARLIEPIPAL